MSDYIKREDALKDADTIDPKYSDLIRRVKDIINAQPSADVVEVVRCKDCKHYEFDGYCKTICGFMLPDFYCSDGERKEQEHENR